MCVCVFRCVCVCVRERERDRERERETWRDLGRKREMSHEQNEAIDYLGIQL